MAWSRPGNARGWFPRSLLSGRRVRHPAVPLRPRHGYAVVLHRDLPAQADDTQPGVPACDERRCAPRTSPHPPGSSWQIFKRRNDTGSSRIPSRLAHRARPVRQSQAVTTLSRLLPPSPPTRGSGCLQLHPAATTARRPRSLTSVRNNSASWRSARKSTATCSPTTPYPP